MTDKLDKIIDDIGAIKIVLTSQAGDIKEHIRRTNILEEMVKETKGELKPVIAHVNRVDGAMKLLGGGSLIAMIVTAIIEALAYFRH